MALPYLFFSPFKFSLVDRCKSLGLKEIPNTLQRWAVLPWDL